MRSAHPRVRRRERRTARTRRALPRTIGTVISRTSPTSASGEYVVTRMNAGGARSAGSHWRTTHTLAGFCSNEPSGLLHLHKPVRDLVRPLGLPRFFVNQILTDFDLDVRQ